MHIYIFSFIRSDNILHYKILLKRKIITDVLHKCRCFCHSFSPAMQVYTIFIDYMSPYLSVRCQRYFIA